jgi:hypothetical protein
MLGYAKPPTFPQRGEPPHGNGSPTYKEYLLKINVGLLLASVSKFKVKIF